MTFFCGKSKMMALGATFLTGILTPNAEALTFNFTGAAGSNVSADALAGFQEAADLWSAVITDNIVVNIEISFNSTDFGATTLGAASSTSSAQSVSNVVAALTNNSVSSTDSSSVASLPGGSFDYIRNDQSSDGFFLDNNGTSNNNNLSVTNANAKVLGLIAGDATGIDAEIGFNSAFAFDFDRSDGISSNEFDFVGIAAHEIGHALGFTSGVDTIDAFDGLGPNAALTTNLDNFAIASVFDLFRFNEDGDRDLSTTADTFFSVDGGVTNSAFLSTGAFNGDGQQASHFRDNEGLGILDPTFSAGELGVISSLDLLAFDTIGFTVIPEPSSTVFGGIGCVLMLSARRRKIS